MRSALLIVLALLTLPACHAALKVRCQPIAENLIGPEDIALDRRAGDTPDRWLVSARAARPHDSPTTNGF
ncbi:MAG: hypothetical protein ABI629_02355 [bacterium]